MKNKFTQGAPTKKPRALTAKIKRTAESTIESGRSSPTKAFTMPFMDTRRKTRAPKAKDT